MLEDDSNEVICSIMELNGVIYTLIRMIEGEMELILEDSDFK